ncbi:MAG: 23S rRNA (guanosine(2251)-2'-O)-methyltransferase RlmB [Bdellovibrionales bacterium]
MKNNRKKPKTPPKKPFQNDAKPRPPQKKPDQPKGPRPTIYGFHAVREAWLNENREVHTLYASEAGLKTLEDVIGRRANVPVRVVDKHALESLLPQGAVHQGLALAATPLEEYSVQDFVIKSAAAQRSVYVMLDQVTDPHNVGAILRSACVFGLSGMILQRKHAPDLDGVLAKTACGAVEHIPVAYETNLSRCLETLKEAGFFIYGLDERGTDIAAMGEMPDKIVLVMGAEGPGLRRLVKENCDSLLSLPVRGPIPSLNVSNAAAVAFYAVTLKL